MKNCNQPSTKQLATKYLIILFFVSLSTSLQISAQEIKVDDTIRLIHLQDSVFVHETFATDEFFGTFSSNGLLVIRSGEALMVDTPIDNQTTRRLVTWLKDSLNTDVTMFIAGHYHNDCLGGLEYLHQKGVKSIANVLTAEKCSDLNLPVPNSPFTNSLTFDFHGETIDCRYFGAGHTFDNITIWLPRLNILFGGCLIKSTESVTLGNLADAVVGTWDTTVLKLMAAYNDVKIVVPGHGKAGGDELLRHTLHLVKSHKKR